MSGRVNRGVARRNGRDGGTSVLSLPGDAASHILQLFHQEIGRRMENHGTGELGTYQALESVVARLLAPGGCPWDREQTHQSLKRNLLEECHEVMEAIDRGDPDNLAEELGDVLLQVVFHIQLAQESGEFGPEDVFTAINKKLVRRHPHVFGGTEALTAEEVKGNWERIKQQERVGTSRLGDVPRALPSLARSQLIQDRASMAGFDWDGVEGVMAKVQEEIRELEEAKTPEEREAELGDILLALVNVGRWLDVQVEDSLRHANDRFSQRFECMEGLCRERGVDFVDLPMEGKEALWQEAKKLVG